ncbi:Protein involved in sex pheromone biosynthesis [Mesobacillus persicus]|uniref:Protein involved in sex pheromone biosynthesis n=1 Tax=Mesobacillus persicus TaxID=930146 RepID=A0A1H8CCA6_9BACI|nr:CamS family sex pheromone protein [Mesobacillus persicus]SEM92685.1 Protein involved in sex pheromone biosynthesis [Mesobacillus persicus]
MKKYFIIIAVSVVLLLAACAPNFQKEDQIVQEKDDETNEKAIIPKYKISDEYYRTFMPFEPGEARGLVVNNLNTRYDIHEFETGLMRIAQNTFDTTNFVFKEGQYLDSSTVSSWLNRKYTEEQLKSLDMTEEDNLGLNPIDPGTGDFDKRNEENPIYLSHILEHNYLEEVSGKKGTYKLGGVVIGLALNSIHYYQKVAYGATYETSIPHDKLEAEGKKIAQEVVKRLRTMEELKNIPITIALFEQKSRSSVVPGNFFAFAEVDKSSTNIGSWQNVKEKYVLFPSDTAQKNHREDMTWFQNFKQDVEEYFPNFNGVVGKGFYLDDQLQQLSISIPIQFYGKSEAIGFTQYVTGLVMEHFPDYVAVEVNVSSVYGQEALIVRNPNQNEPFVHVYQY